jgi:selenide,water dikinase
LKRKRHILCDPQTSGGLLIATKRAAQKWNQSKSKGLYAEPIENGIRIDSLYIK